MPVTIKDVARRAGLSIASVSRALNGTGVVTETTRSRVLEAARELRYVPDETARSLIRRRSDTMGVLLPDLYGEYFSEILRSIDRAARQRGLHLLVSSSHGDAKEAARALRSMNGRVDGVLIMSPFSNCGELIEAISESIPAVLMNTPDDRGRWPGIQIDNYGGAYAMVEHLAAIGHRHIAHITGPLDNYEAAERLRGYHAAIRAAAANSNILHGDFSETSGYLAGRALLAARALPDAVFAASDMMAIGCLLAFREAGVEVPRQVAVAGFDDIPAARYITPPLTTVRTQATEIGARALEMLAQTVDDPAAMRVGCETLRTELVIRNSCGGEMKP